MAGFSDKVSRGVLDHITGKTTMFTMSTTVNVRLLTAIGIDAGTGFTEVTGGGYAAQPVAGTAWNAATGSAPSTATTNTAIGFPISTGTGYSAGASIIAFAITTDSSAISSTNLEFSDYLGSTSWVPFSCSLASPGVINIPAHGLSVGNLVAVKAEDGGTLPTGMTASTGSTLYTIGTTPTADTLTLTGVNTSATGSGQLRLVTPLVVSGANITPSIASGGIVLTSG